MNRPPRITVTCAAIRTDDGVVHSVPAPGRHCDVIQAIREGGYEGPVGGERQGFLLINGGFVGRRVAKNFARRVGQILGGRSIASTLTSEDLW